MQPFQQDRTKRTPNLQRLPDCSACMCRTLTACQGYTILLGTAGCLTLGVNWRWGCTTSHETPTNIKPQVLDYASSVTLHLCTGLACRSSERWHCAHSHAGRTPPSRGPGGTPLPGEPLIGILPTAGGGTPAMQVPPPGPVPPTHMTRLTPSALGEQSPSAAQP